MLNTIKPKLDDVLAPFDKNVDYGVYNSNQIFRLVIFRLVNNKKLDKPTFLHIVSEHIFKDSLISNVELSSTEINVNKKKRKNYQK